MELVYWSSRTILEKEKKGACWATPVPHHSPTCAAPVALPWHPEVRHFDHLRFPHQAVPSSLQKQKSRRSVLEDYRCHIIAFILFYAALQNRKIRVVSYYTKKTRTLSPNAFCTLHSQHVPVASKAIQPSVWCMPLLPRKSRERLKYPQLPTVLQ